MIFYFISFSRFQIPDSKFQNAFLHVPNFFHLQIIPRSFRYNPFPFQIHRFEIYVLRFHDVMIDILYRLYNLPSNKILLLQRLPCAVGDTSDVRDDTRCARTRARILGSWGHISFSDPRIPHSTFTLFTCSHIFHFQIVSRSFKLIPFTIRDLRSQIHHFTLHKKDT